MLWRGPSLQVHPAWYQVGPRHRRLLMKMPLVLKTGFAMLGLSMLLGSPASAAAPATPAERVADQAQIGDSVRAVGLDSLSDLSVRYPGGATGYPDVVYQTLLGYRPM